MCNPKARHYLLILVFSSRRGLSGFRQLVRLLGTLLIVVSVAVLVSGCRFFDRAEPTRTPIPTFTPTPILVVVPAGAVQATARPVQTMTPEAVVPQPVQQLSAPAEIPTDTPAPPTDTPTIPPTASATSTPVPTPTSTPTPSPTAIPDYPFELESAEKFPTESLAPNVVRVYLYVYAPGSFGLADYRLHIRHNGVPIASDALSKGGLPALTRQDPGPYSRFTNLDVIVVESQAGEWTVQLADKDGIPVGPPAEFELSADENTRELYVRYRQKAN